MYILIYIFYYCVIVDSHWTNPQYKVTLSDSDEDDDSICSFIIQLMQKDRRKIKQSGKKNLHIGFLVYRVSTIKFTVIDDNHFCRIFFSQMTKLKCSLCSNMYKESISKWNKFTMNSE